jgi:hypothetical protein
MVMTPGRRVDPRRPGDRVIEASPLWDATVREALIDFLRDHHPAGLPTYRGG